MVSVAVFIPACCRILIRRRLHEGPGSTNIQIRNGSRRQPGPGKKRPTLSQVADSCVRGPGGVGMEVRARLLMRLFVLTTKAVQAATIILSFTPSRPLHSSHSLKCSACATRPKPSEQQSPSCMDFKSLSRACLLGSFHKSWAVVLRTLGVQAAVQTHVVLKTGLNLPGGSRNLLSRVWNLLRRALGPSGLAAPPRRAPWPLDNSPEGPSTQ